MTHHCICIVTEGDIILEFFVLELTEGDSGTLSLFELGVPKVCFLKKKTKQETHHLYSIHFQFIHLLNIRYWIKQKRTIPTVGPQREGGLCQKISVYIGEPP